MMKSWFILVRVGDRRSLELNEARQLAQFFRVDVELLLT